MLTDRISRSVNQVNASAELLNEIDHLLGSIVGKKTNQGLILAYLAQIYVRGEEAAKEHAIAVDALGRGSDFDPKREAIVRVEVHKLRRTLKAYYTGPGRNRPVQVALGLGKYALVVDASGAPRAETAAAAPEESKLEIVVPPVEPAPLPRPRWLLVVATAAVVLLFVGYIAWNRQPTSPPDHQPSVANTPANTVRILAGSPDRRYVDSLGHEWLGDRYVNGGRAGSSSAWIRNTPDQGLYKGYREGDFLYEVPLAPGDYEVRIHFAETFYGYDNLNGGGEASRLFQIHLNSTLAASAMDVILHAGGANLAAVKVFPGQRPQADGKLRIRFESNSNEKAFVNAIEIVPGLKDRMLPFRIAAGSTAIAVDPKGQTWLPDRYAIGGRMTERLRPVQADIPELFRFERFGRFEYVLPAVPGHQFQLKLWMAEQYFGVHTPAGGAPRRVFDIFHNGNALLRDFSILDAAGGPAKGVQRTFQHLSPDAQGNIRILFTPTANYAALNAIELIDEGPAGRYR